MKVLLISANTEPVNLPTLPLGLALVGAAAREAGHDATFLNLMFQEDAEAAVRVAIAASHPDVVGISVRNIDDQTMQGTRFLLEPVRHIVSACRASTNAPVIVGGAGYSIFPEPALSYLSADIGVRGEGERVFPAVLARLERRETLSGLPGVFVAGRGGGAAPGFVADLDELPFPAHDAWLPAAPGAPDAWAPVQSRRGCPLDCSYCSTSSIEGRATRARSPRLVAEEISRAAAAGFCRVYFVDNTFNLPAAYALELCRQIERLGLGVSWRCILYPHDVSDDLVQAMARAGCVEVSVGFESGSPRVLRAMNKRYTPEDVRRVSEMLAERGILRHGFLLLGGPGETRESVDESLAFAASLRLDSLKVTLGIRIYPGTPLARTALQQGVISVEDDLLRPRFYLSPGLEQELPPLSGGPGAPS
jgi:radical SAM superfamily enzyme YgiQ (UPF0313 family)